MSGALKLLGFFFWGGLMPILQGLLPVGLLYPKGERKIHRVVTFGYLTSFTLFEVIGLPILFLTPLGDFNLLVRIYTALSVIVAVLGLWFFAGRRGENIAGITEKIRSTPNRLKERLSGKYASQEFGFLLIFFLLLGFELYMAYTRASFDGDDAYYVAQSLQTWQTGTMYHYVPYTGVSTTLDGRHAMAMIPMWISYVATMCATHPTIVTHSMIPLVFLPVTDLAYYFAASTLLENTVSERKRRRMLPAFLCILAVMQIFGNTSIYTPETFLLMRTWQGKSVFVNFIIPLSFVALLLLVKGAGEEDKNGKRRAYVIMILCNAAAGFCTSIAPMFTALMFLSGALYVRILLKKKGVLWRTILCCIPNLIYALILVWIMLPVLLTG